jgi:hypothetical protein
MPTYQYRWMKGLQSLISLVTATVLAACASGGSSTATAIRPIGSRRIVFHLTLQVLASPTAIPG